MARVTFLAHSGFSVKTGANLLIFDYLSGMAAPASSDRAIAFISHAHHDHFSNEPLAWRDRGLCELVVGYDLPESAGGVRMKPGDEAIVDGARVRAFGSTDQGVSFLVESGSENIFHAGDGNMHPIILFDARKPGDLKKAQKAGFDILEYCIQVGGSITGEHGIGMEKVHLMDKQYSAESLSMMRRIRELFDPARLFNPGKLLPAGRGCAEIRQPPLVSGSTIY